jgi:hypothetical protein
MGTDIMKKLLSCVTFLGLLSCIACGTGLTGSNGNPGSPGFGGGGTAGNSSAASLSGNYTYQLAGYDLSTTAGQAIPFRESGTFVADGNGHITGGEDDFAEGSSVTTHTIAASTYSISNDGTGQATINFTNSGGLQVALSLVSSPTVYLAVNVIAPNGTSLFANGTGVALKQSTSAFATAPSGAFAFSLRQLSTAQGSSASIGAFTVTGGAVSGNEDVIRGAVQSSLTLTGSFNVPDASGRGTGSFTDGLGVTLPFAYYLVDSSHLRLFSTATGNIGIGQAQAQSGTFSAATVSGSYAFGTTGDDAFSLDGVKTAGQFVASNGTISAGQFDSVRDSSVVSGTFTGGTYTVAANGRTVVNLTPSTGGSIQEIAWMVSPARAFLLTNDTTKVEVGTADLQSSTSFSKSSTSGTFGFAMDGFTNPPFTSTPQIYNRVGNMHWDGAGNLGLTEFVNVTGSGTTSGILNGSYTVAANGRVVGTVSGLSNNLFFYLISASQAYILQADGGVEIGGNLGSLP